MKKITIILLLFLFLLTGCNEKDNPTIEELVNLYETSEQTKDYFSVEKYVEVDDDDLYEERVMFFDNRPLEENKISGNNSIEIYENEQKATIGYEYDKEKYRQVYEYSIENEMCYAGEPILIENYIYRIGNIVLVVDGNLEESKALEYYDILDDYLGDNKYKQLNTLSEQEYEDLYKKSIDSIPAMLEEYYSINNPYLLSQASAYLDECFIEYEKTLSDEDKEHIEYVINDLYSGKFFDENREVWNKRFEEINKLKEEKDNSN